MSVRVRNDVWKLAPWDPILEWYAKAVTEMQSRPLDDPTSWRYQAAIHEYSASQDPNADGADTLPAAGEQRRFWSQCQHNSWFFLPWHRMYLAYFEEIVASTVKALGGPEEWALPYWNYSDASNANGRRLPPAFRASTTPDGSPNPLRVDVRRPNCNAGNIMSTPADVDLRTCLRDPMFIGLPGGGNPGFGGPQTVFNHSGGAVGKVESTPHGSMHVAVGGFMGRFNTAGLDPLFWLHHANIDRLWVVWRRRNARHLDPTLASWLTGVTFEFHDAAGGVVSHTAVDVVATATTPPLGYRYQDESDPLPPTPAPPVEGVGRPTMTRQPIPEMVGATDRPVILTGQPATARLAITSPTGPARPAAAADEPAEIYLNIENITGTGDPTSYSVYLNVPAGADPEEHPELFAGVLPMFGVAEASQTDQNHTGSGLHYALEVGEIVRRLQTGNDWNPADIRISFVPQEPEVASPGAPSAAASPIQVGRVSLYFA